MKDNDFQIKFDESQRLYKLQRDLESGKMAENDISFNDKEKLIELYEQQISNLEESIKNKKKKLRDYKNKILEKRKLLK